MKTISRMNIDESLLYSFGAEDKEYKSRNRFLEKRIMHFIIFRSVKGK
jgi:hypothetical protein